MSLFVENAIRECCEEAGVVCPSMIPLFDYPQGIDVIDSHAYLFQSSDVSDKGSIQGMEIDARKWVPLDECIRMVFADEIKDSMTMMALLVYTHSGLPAKG